MRIHPVTRQIAHGIGGEGVYVDGRQIAPGGGKSGMPDWMGDQVLYCTDAGLVASQADGSAKTLIAAPSTFVRASAAGWASWSPQRGVVTSWGLTLPEAVLLDMATDGTLLVGDNYQSGVGISAYSAGSTTPLWSVEGARPALFFPYAQASILDAHTACWTETLNGRRVLAGVGLAAAPGDLWNVFHPRLFRVNGEVWVAYLRGEDDRTIAHPWDYQGQGFSQPGFGFGPDASFDGDTLTLYWSEAAGELPGDIQQMPCDLSNIEVIPSLPAPPVVTPIAPNVPSFQIFGYWKADANAPGNAAIGYEDCPVPPHACIIASEDTIADVPTERLAALLAYFVPADDEAKVRTTITRLASIAAQYRVPLCIYDDQQRMRFALFKSACANAKAPSFMFPQWTLAPGQDPTAFAAAMVSEAKAFRGHPFVGSLRLYTSWRLTPDEEARGVPLDEAIGYHAVPADAVVAGSNALIEQGALEVEGCMGAVGFAFARLDAVGGAKSRESLAPIAKVWSDVPTTAVNGRQFADQFFQKEPTVEPRKLTAEEAASVQEFFANNPLRSGDGSEGWLDTSYRNPPDGLTFRLSQHMCFKHGPRWGHKRRSKGAPRSAGSIAYRLTDGTEVEPGAFKADMHVFDLLIGVGTGQPRLDVGVESLVVQDGQEWLQVDPVNHVDSQKPRTGRALWPSAVKHGVSGFDVAARVQAGDFTYYDLTAPLPLNVFVYTTIDNPQTHRLGRTFAEGLAQTETLLKKLTADGRQAMFIMVCGPHTVNNGPRPTRAEILDMVRQQVALFERYPKAVLALSLGNELYQGFEPPELLDPTLWAEVDALVPLQFPFAIGQVGDAVVFGPGSVAMMHPDRGKSSIDALQILADAQRAAGLTVVAREPARIEAGGSGQSRGDINFVREELDNAKRLNLPYFLHLAAGRGAYVPAMDDVQHQALEMIKAEAGTVVTPPPPPPPPPTDDDLTVLGKEARRSAIIIAYRTLLDREPDPVGWEEYTEKLKSGWTVQQMEDHIRNSAEYRAKHGG